MTEQEIAAESNCFTCMSPEQLQAAQVYLLEQIRIGGGSAWPYVLRSGDTMTGPLVNSTNGALSTPAVSITGTPITGGSATTTKPLVLIEPFGTTSTGWSTSGTMLGVNAHNAFTGNLIDAQLNGVSKFSVTTAQMLAPDGTAAAPGISWGSDPDTGFSKESGNRIAVSIGGTIRYYFDTVRIQNLSGSAANPSYAFSADNITGMYLGGAATALSFSVNGAKVAQFGTGDAFALGASSDTILRRAAPANLALGAADAASPVAQTISVQNVASGTSNTAGVAFTRQCSLGTGTGGSGDDVIKQGITGASGTTVNTAGTRVYRRAKETTLTEATATKLFTVPLAAGGYIGLTIEATVFASDGTDFQCLTSVLNVNAVAKSTTITGTITQADGTVAASSGTLTPVTFTVVDDGSNVLSVKCAATSSLVQTTLSCKWAIRNINANVSATITPL